MSRSSGREKKSGECRAISCVFLLANCRAIRWGAVWLCHLNAGAISHFSDIKGENYFMLTNLTSRKYNFMENRCNHFNSYNSIQYLLYVLNKFNCAYLMIEFWLYPKFLLKLGILLTVFDMITIYMLLYF